MNIFTATAQIVQSLVGKQLRFTNFDGVYTVTVGQNMAPSWNSIFKNLRTVLSKREKSDSGWMIGYIRPINPSTGFVDEIRCSSNELIPNISWSYALDNIVLIYYKITPYRDIFGQQQKRAQWICPLKDAPEPALRALYNELFEAVQSAILEEYYLQKKCGIRANYLFITERSE